MTYTSNFKFVLKIIEMKFWFFIQKSLTTIDLNFLFNKSNFVGCSNTTRDPWRYIETFNIVTNKVLANHNNAKNKYYSDKVL